MPKIDIEAVTLESSTNYPAPFRRDVEGRMRKRLGNAIGLDQFGVNLTMLKPGAWSSQRHWHAREDELIVMLSGELVLCENDGETLLRAGDAAGWKAGASNGHCLINRTQADATFIEIGTRSGEETVTYPDIDMRMERSAGGSRYVKKSGEKYPA